MKIKALLVLLHIKNDSDSRKLQPLGISYLHAILKENNIDCDILDCNLIDGFKDNDLLKIIKDKKYNFVGFSIFSSSYPRVLKVAKKIKKMDQSIFVSAGGVHSTICHESIIKDNDCFDFAMRGDGERQLLNLIQDIELNDKPTVFYDGISYKSLNGETKLTDVIYQEKELSSLPFPTRDNCDKYSTRLDQKTGKQLINIGVSTSRGCPYQCAFCSIPCMSSKWRGRTPDNIAEEIYQIYQKNKDIFIIYVDDNFFVDPKRSIEIVKHVNEKCGAVLPFSFATRANQILKAGEEIIEFLQKNGCVAIEVGIENGSDPVLMRMNKGTTKEQNSQAIQLLKKFNINVGVDFIMFDKYSSLEEIKENIDFFKENGLWGYYPTLIYKSIIPYPGTKVSQEYKETQPYFEHKGTEIIYDYLNKFFLEYAIKIENILKNPNNSLSSQELTWIKTIPYNYLETIIKHYGDKKMIRLETAKFKKSIKNSFKKCYDKYKG